MIKTCSNTNRINFFSFILFIVFLLPTVTCSQNLANEKSPNIILFLVDDMGWQDTSVAFWTKRTPFNDIYQTPNMEKLAQEGMKFTQAYATAVCSPTRISLMTGMNAARHRVTNWTLRKDEIQPMEKNHKELEFPLWNVNGLSPIPNIPHTVYAKPLPQILKDAGYFTIHSGKAHLGAIGTPGEDPTKLGFDVNIAGHAAGAPASYYGTDDFGNAWPNKEIWSVPGLETYHGKDIFLTEAITLEAIKSMNTALQKQQPFFLYMAHYAVHTPIMGDKRFLQKYLDQGMDEKEAKYATLIEGMDKSLGDLMKFLEQKNIADNTIILFMSDNGGLSAVARGGEPHTHNWPLSSGKGSAYEGGIREPMLVKWPGVVQPNSLNENYLIIEDFFPTIIEMAKIKDLHVPQAIDGRTFVPLLKEKKASKERALFWHYPNEWGPEGPGIDASSSIRKGDWKLIYYHRDERMELFNLTDDIGEKRNLVEDQPEKTKELAIALSEHLIAVEAQMPTHRNSQKKVKYPKQLINR